MNSAKSLLRLELLVQVCHQLPDEESERLMLLAVDDAQRFTSEVLALHSHDDLWLPTSIIDLLLEDLSALPVAV